MATITNVGTEMKMNAPKGSRGGNVVKGFADILFSWSLEDIFNENLFSNKIKKIPETFASVEDYQKSFVYPLLEETREDLCSSLETISAAPYAKLTEFRLLSRSIYHVEPDWWRNGVIDPRKAPYRTMPGDLLLLVDARPRNVDDLKRFGRTWTLALVTEVMEDDKDPTSIRFYVVTPKEKKTETRDLLFAIFLVGTTPSQRIWDALHWSLIPNIIRKVLDIDSLKEEECRICSAESGGLEEGLPNDLNDSQKKANSVCLRKARCQHTSSIELIWGPPGTGKTKTTSVMLLTLLQTKCRALVCAPTNIAVMEVASRVLQLIRSSSSVEYGRNSKLCPLGDILLFGNKARLKVDRKSEEIYLDYRVKRIAECLAPLTGWRNCITQMIDLLNNSLAMYRSNLVMNIGCGEPRSFLVFVRERFGYTTMRLERCLSTLCTHISKRVIDECHFHEIIRALSELKLFGNLLYGQYLMSLRLEEVFSSSEVESPQSTFTGPLLTLYLKRIECLSALTTLMDYLSKLKFPNFKSKLAIAGFCYKTASMLFCTASTSYRLRRGRKVPLDLLVIDEAAQLRECESMIPLQLQGLRHATLIGDEKQLPSVVKSKVAKEAGFGRSLFERLSSLGASKHLLNMQYRMHPSISLFPNHAFYSGQIHDAPNVMDQSYSKSYLPSPFFGHYSFINISDGREERYGNGNKSLRNSVEVDVVLGILNKLWKAWSSSKNFKEKLSVGVISPYSAQVSAIHEKLGRRYENLGGFEVKVMTVDGFQGGEQDIIIISSVRSNSDGSIGFLSSPQRTNVALTRARYCLWILGSEETLTRRPSEWAALVNDVKDRGCFFNAEEDKDLTKAIIEAKKKGDCLQDLLYDRSLLFKSARWKVIFPESFFNSFQKLSRQTKSSVVDLLQKLSSGWRPNKKINLDIVCPKSSQIIKKFKVEDFHVIWTVDIEKEPTFVQVLKFWYIVPGSFIEEKVKHLDIIYKKCGYDFINRCKEKCFEGELEVPKVWENPSDFRVIANASRNHNKEDTKMLKGYNDEEKLVIALQSLELHQKAEIKTAAKERLKEGTLDVPRVNLNAMLEDLKHIDAALDVRELKLEKMSEMKEIIERLQSRRHLMEPFLNQIFHESDSCSSVQRCNGEKVENLSRGNEEFIAKKMNNKKIWKKRGN